MINCNAKFKDRPAVTVESESLRATLLHEDGAKLASLVRLSDGKELLAVKPGEKYKPLSYGGSYVKSECSGFDDMFPTVDPYTPSGYPEGVTYPDHGETCRIPYELTLENECAVFRAKSRLFPILYEKRVFSDSKAVIMSYSFENFGEQPFDFLWAGHIMLAGEDGMKIISPFGADAPTETMFGPEGVDPESLPRDRLMGFSAGLGAAYKFYYTEPMKEGSFGVSYPDGTSLIFELDEKKLPYLGIWLNNGAFQDIYTITPEPCSAPFDSPDRAARRGIKCLIPPHEKFSFDIKITSKESIK